MPEQLKKEQIATELKQVRDLSEDGLLHPEKAVAWARQHKRSALYWQLEWDDTKAAELHRIDQVRQLIRIVVTRSEETDRMVRAYVSQPSDRVHGGGYRSVGDSLNRARQELVNEALNRIKSLRNQFTHLPELDQVFNGIDRLVQEYLGSARQAS